MIIFFSFQCAVHYEDRLKSKLWALTTAADAAEALLLVHRDMDHSYEQGLLMGNCALLKGGIQATRTSYLWKWINQKSLEIYISWSSPSPVNDRWGINTPAPPPNQENHEYIHHFRDSLRDWAKATPTSPLLWTLLNIAPYYHLPFPV